VKYYFLYVDILGFKDKPNKISSKKKIDSVHVRKIYFTDNFRNAVRNIQKISLNSHQSFSEITGSDSFVFVFDYKQNIYNILSKLITIPLIVDDGNLPVQIACDINECDFEPNVGLINTEEYKNFLSNDIINPYREYYKKINKDSIKDSYVLVTKKFYDELPILDRKNFKQISFKSKIFYKWEPLHILKRSKVYDFLYILDITNNPFYNRIEEVFVPPIEYDEILESLDKNKIIFITGTPQYGKTYTAIRILWEYYLKGYIPIWRPGKEEEQRVKLRDRLEAIENELNPHTIIYYEDPFGTIKYEKRENLERDIGMIIDSISTVEDVYVVITSREEIFKEFENENISSLELKNFEKKINIKKPSYDRNKRKQILIKWAEAKNCVWLNYDFLKDIIFTAMDQKNKLPTPLKIRDFVYASINLTNPKKIMEKIEEKSKETARQFALEISNMSEDKFLFLSYPLISNFFTYGFVESEYKKMIFELNIKNAWDFDQLLIWFEDKVDYKYGYIRFVHSSYKEALEYLLEKSGKGMDYKLNIIYQVMFETIKTNRFQDDIINILNTYKKKLPNEIYEKLNINILRLKVEEEIRKDENILRRKEEEKKRRNENIMRLRKEMQKRINEYSHLKEKEEIKNKNIDILQEEKLEKVKRNNIYQFVLVNPKLKYSKNTNNKKGISSIIDVPCLLCSSIDRCNKNMIYSPENCLILERWLKLLYN